METGDSASVEEANHVSKPSVHHDGDGQIIINTATARVKVTEADVVVIRNGTEHKGLPLDEQESLEFHFERDELRSDRVVDGEPEPSRFGIVDL